MTDNETWLGLYDSQVQEAFGSLLTQRQFRHVDAQLHPPECWVVYENVTTRITVSFELGVGPWVELERKKSSVLPFLSRERYDLAFLLMLRAPEEIQESVIVNLDDPRLLDELHRLSQQLEQYGGDVLAGDFSVFPELRKRADENMKRRE